MSERNAPLKVTRAAAFGYALYYVLYSPHVDYGSGTMWATVIVGAVMLFVVAAIEVRIVRRRKSTDQADEPRSPGQ